MKPILVLGAAGYTGRLVCEALERLGRPYILAGRDRSRLEALAASLVSKPEVRVADATSPESLAGALSGAGVVANTVGPFLRYGLPVVEAAIRARAHYVDTTAEQAFQRAVYERFHKAAREAGVAVITAQACDFAFAYCGAWVLEERFGPLARLDSYHRLEGFGVSRGTAKSALGMVREDYLVFREGRFETQRAAWRPERVEFPDEREPQRAVPFPGGDVVLLPHEIPTLRDATASLVLPEKEARRFAVFSALRPLARPFLGPRLLRRIEARIDRTLPEPAEAERRAARFTIVVRGQGVRGAHACRIDGADVYGITGDLAALGAAWLAEGRAKAAGVLTTGKALEAAPFLDALAGRGVRWSVA